MCTVSWLHQDGGYQLLCNRDERRSRAPAAGPVITTKHGVRSIAPTDGDAGGTWIGANEFGLTLCLLNGPPRRVESGRRCRSRGLLLPELLSGLSATAVSERVWRSDLACYAPFTLAILEPGRHTCVVEWDGEEKAVVPYGEPFMPLVSSSFDSEGVLTKRRQLFQRRLESAGKLDSEVLFDFHRSHGAKAGAYSPCMHRPDAETVSFTWVKVTYDEVEFCYAPGAPCLWNPGELLKLPLLR